MARTRWIVETETIRGNIHLTLELVTDDPRIVKNVEKAARDAGVKLVQDEIEIARVEAGAV